MDVNTLIAQAQASADTLPDQTDVQSGDFVYAPPPAGPTPARFVGYVEVGVRPQKPYLGKDKPDCEEVRLYFELNGKKHITEVPAADGKPATSFTNTINVKMTLKLNDKAGFTKLFRKMAYGRENIKHMAAMLGEGFLITIVHNVVEKDGKKTTYANMKDADGVWLIGAPMYADPLSGDTTPIPVPAVTAPIKLLLWDNPTQEQWDSIFIDGTRTQKDDKGVETEVSKNWLQTDIVEDAKNFPGSPLEALLGGVAHLTLEEDVIEAPEVAESENPAPEAETAPVEKPAQEVVETAPAKSADDILAALGM